MDPANPTASPPAAVLIVDDRPDKLLALEAVLSSLDVRLVKACSGAEALARVEDPTVEFAVVILDVHMPVMDGLETARRIRKIASCPIIFVSANVSDERLAEAYELGAVDFLTHPIIPAALRTKISVFVQLYNQRNEIRARAEEEVRIRTQRAAHEQIGALIESIPEAFYALDHDWRYTYINGQCETYYGRKREELLGQVLWEVFPVVRGTIFEIEYRRAIREQTPVHFEVYSLLIWRWVEVHAYPSRDGLLVYFRDISDRKEAEEAIQRGEARFQALIEKSFDAICLVSAEGVVTYASPAISRIIGYTTDEYVGSNATERIHQDDQQRIFRLLAALIQEPGASASAEYRYQHKDGRWLWLEATATNLVEDPHVQGVVCNIRDITESKEALDREQRARQEAEAANSAKDRFLAALSHELRTPLTPVIALLPSVLNHDDLPEELRYDLSMIDRNVRMEARLIDDLLDLTRIARGRLQLQLQRTDAHAAVQHAVTIIQEDTTIKGLKLEVELNAQDRYVRADPTRLQQVLWNLLKNAAKFTPQNGSIRIVSSNPGRNRIKISVTDTGIGIEPEQIPKLFNAFSPTLEATSYRFGGLGLGLSISKAILEKHGGTIVVDSAGQGRGSTFTIELQTVTAPDRESLQSSLTQLESARSLSILLIEDNPNTLEVLARLLRRRGHQVETATCVLEALSTAETHRFDLVISDIGLPDGSGLDLMPQLKKRYGLKGIAISGFGMESDIQKSSEAGFAAHLTKPVDFRQLTHALHQVAAVDRN